MAATQTPIEQFELHAAMQAMGHGVGLRDAFGSDVYDAVKVPYVEFSHCSLEKDYAGYRMNWIKYLIYFGLGVIAGGLIVDAVYQRRIEKSKGAKSWLINTARGSWAWVGFVVLRKSKNLRAMRDHARVSKVARVVTNRDPANQVRGVLRVTYADGAYSNASFASYHVMIDWVRNRRTWRGAEIVHTAEDVGYLTKPGIIAGGMPGCTGVRA